MTRRFKDHLHCEVTIDQPATRIISLVPSQTELLFYLGLDDRIAGITKFCVHPSASVKGKTIIGGTKHFHFDVIDKINPDLIIGNKEENFAEGIEALREKYPVWMSDIVTIDDALSMINSVGLITGTESRAQRLTSQVKEKFAVPNAFIRVKALYMIWSKPWMAAASGTFIDSMMAAAGMVNVLKDNERYPELPGEEIVRLSPDVILLSSEPFPFKDEHRDLLNRLVPRAKILFVDGEMFSWYGNRMLEAADYFGTLKLS